MANNKNIKKPKKTKNTKLEIAEEINIDPKFKPSQTGSVSQNTSRPVKPRKK